MKVLLLGTYVNNRQQSMQRFADMMRQGLVDAGHEVRLVRPPVVLGRMRPSETGLGKWIGYIDRYILFPPLLRWQTRWADVVHICSDAIYVAHVRGKPHVVTSHDVLPIRAAFGEIPESRVGWTGKVYQRLFLNSLRRAQMVVCVSEQTLKEAQRLTALPASRFAVVPNALNYPYRPMPTDAARVHLRTLGLEPPQQFFLHVGGNQWYKNREGVLQIFAELVKHPAYHDHLMVMVGKRWTVEMRRLIERLNLQNRVIERVEVTNEQLRALYATAEALLFPSLQEGFGWPVAEAQACGCPVAATDRPPMTDVGGDAAIYIDPADTSGAASTIATALVERDCIRLAGLENAARFSTEAMIDSYVRCFRTATERRPLSTGMSVSKGTE